MMIKLSALIIVALFTLLSPFPIFAQTATSSAMPMQSTVYSLPSTVSPTSPIYTDLLVNNLFHSFSCIAVGQSVIGQPCLTYQVTRNAQGAVQSIPVLSSVNLSGGVLGSTTSLIGALYTNQPVRTVDYLASVDHGLGIVKTTNAQVVGSGAQVLNPVLALWQVSRNISYVIMIIIFLIIGLMVMFRNKINPQTVITAQAALPGLVIGLIMITFSFFFAGLISDMAFLGTNVVAYYFSMAQNPNDPPQNLVKDMSTHNALSVLSPMVKIVNVGSVSEVIGSIWDNLAAPNSNFLPWNFGPQQLLTSLAAMLIAQFVLPLGSLFGGIGQLIGGGAAAGYTIADPVHSIGFALAFVGMAILIYTMFRLLLRLVNVYLNIVFLTLSAPFQFLAAALPGRQGIATGWFQNMLASTLAFPAVLAVLYFVAFLLGPEILKDNCADPCPFKISSVNQQQNNNLVVSVYAQEEVANKRGNVVDSSTFPLLGGFDLNFIRLILAFGALVALPAIPDVIARTIGKVSQAGQLIGQEIGSGVGQGQRYAGQFQQGTTGFANQAGRLTDTTSLQYAYDPTINPRTGRPTGWVSSRVSQPGQLSRAAFGWGNFWSTGYGGRARRRLGI